MNNKRCIYTCLRLSYLIMYTFIPYTYIDEGLHVLVPSTLNILFCDIIFLDTVYSIKLGPGYNNVLQHTKFFRINTII